MTEKFWRPWGTGFYEKLSFALQPINWNTCKAQLHFVVILLTLLLFWSHGNAASDCEGETHRLRGLGAGHGSVDHTVLQDWAGRGVPANVQGVGGGIEDLDVLDSAAHHCRRNRVVGGQRVFGGVESKKVRSGVELGGRKDKGETPRS